MTTTLDVQVLRVFTDPEGGHGNPLGVVFDAAELSSETGTRLTAALGFSETVFVDDEPTAAHRIFLPTNEIKLAGHPAVGTAWVLGQRAGKVPETLRPRLASEPVAAWAADGLVWIRGAVGDAQPWDFVQLDDPAQVEALPTTPGPDVDASDPLAQRGRHQFWAWVDEAAGSVRARTFCADFGIPEDEATGSAAIHLTQQLGRALTIRQGRGSVIHTRPAAEAGWVELGGDVVDDGFRAVSV